MNGFRKFGIVAVLTAMCALVVSCPGNITASGKNATVDPIPSEETRLAKFIVYYNDKTEDNSLISFNPSNQRFTKSIVAESGHQNFIVLAEAINNTAEVLITWTHGSESSDPSESELSNICEISDVPVPLSKEDGNTVIKVTVNNNNDSFNFIVTITPPAIDSTLKSLSVKVGGGANLITNFRSNVLQYVINVDDIGKVGASVVVDAETNDTTGAFFDISNQADNKVPAAGTSALPITVAVTNGSESTVYTISIIPPQSSADNDARLMFLQFEYDDGNAAINNFDADTISYGIQIPNGVTKVKVSQIRAVSNNITGTAVTYGINNTSYTQGTLVNLPLKGAADLTFSIVVTAGNGTTRTYMVGFSNPTQLVIWNGTAEFDAGGNGNKQITSVEVEIANAQSAISEVILGDWSVSISELLHPVNFVVVMKENKGTELVPNWVTYRESFPAGNAQAGVPVDLVVDITTVARMVYNANDLAALGNAENVAENWYLANDIDLAEYTSGTWDGPNNYRGTFNGNGKTIRNLVLTKNNSDTGLFDSLAGGATIKNLIVEVSTPSNPTSTPPNTLQLTSSVRFGGLVGGINADANQPITFKKVTMKGDLRYGNLINSNTFVNLGGLVGEIQGGTVLIEECVSELNISAILGTRPNSDGNNTTAKAGGFVGKVLNANVTIRNSYATGNMIMTMDGERKTAIGGLVGIIGNSTSTGTTLIENCYSSGTISLIKTVGTQPVYSGGLVGGQLSGSIIINNSAALNTSIEASNTTATAYAGRIIGNAAGTRANNYAWNEMTVKGVVIQPSDTGATATGIQGESKDTASMDRAFWRNILHFNDTIWDFTNLSASNYPKLK
jgi:hypothetical protein